MRAERMMGLEKWRWQHRVWRLVVEYAESYPLAQSQALACIVDLCARETARHGADLVTLINLKRAFNRTRGTRHGGLSV